MSHILVAGAGLAGLSSAVALAAAGHRVTLVERRPSLGGRTHALPGRQRGDVVDNGQHVLLAGYRRTRAFLRTIGTEDRLRFDDGLATLFRDPGAGATWLRAPAWLGRLAPLAALLRLGNVPAADRLRAVAALARLGPALAGPPPAALDAVTADAWLRGAGMPDSLRRAFWDPFIVSTLNERPERVSAHMVATVLRWGFLGSPEDGRLGYPTVDLDTLFVTPSVRFLEERGARIIRGAGVAGLAIHDGRVGQVTLQDGRVLGADAYLLALSHGAMARLVARTPLAGLPFFAGIAAIESAPIVAVNVWLDRPLGNRQPYEGLLDTTIEWVFDRTRMHGRATAEGWYYTLIVSASWKLMERTRDQVVAAALESLRLCYGLDPAAVLHTSVVKHPDATFSARPGFARLRRPQTTPVAKLFLAGDWTDTGLPSTMEGAVESGARAVAALERAEAPRAQVRGIMP